MARFAHKIFTYFTPRAAIDVYGDWLGTDWENWNFTENYQEALTQPFKVAMLPALYNAPDTMYYNAELSKLDFSMFDLVVLSDIECHSEEYLKEACIDPAGIKNYIVAVGGIIDPLTDTNFIYRPWWMFHHLRLNKSRDVEIKRKPFMFDALLGARKLHRSHVMARFQNNPDLMSRSIVNYRSSFINHWGDAPSYIYNRIQEILNGKELLWPHVSQNYIEEEVTDLEPHQISEVTPWHIFDKTYYSICCESFSHSMRDSGPGPFFVTEKTTKFLLAKRLFVTFGPMHSLKFLRSLGFMTFGNVIDESYDEIDRAPDRFDRAFDQVEYLATLDPIQVLEQTKHIREHNSKHLLVYQQATKDKMLEMLLSKIPSDLLK
jgi:hypothetical protein